MAGSSPSTLLTIPAEIRLNLYGILITDCLENGAPCDLVGFYRSCRQIHNEFGKEHIRDLQPALAAKHIWDRKFRIHGTLQVKRIKGKCQAENEIRFTTSFCSVQTPTKLALIVDSSMRIISTLLPLCKGKWSVVTWVWQIGIENIQHPTTLSDLIKSLAKDCGAILKYFVITRGARRALNPRPTTGTTSAQISHTIQTARNIRRSCEDIIRRLWGPRPPPQGAQFFATPQVRERELDFLIVESEGGKIALRIHSKYVGA